MFSGIINLFNGLYKNSSTKESEEKLTLLSPQANLQFDETQVQSVLSDFEELEFKDNGCFDKIADDYEKKGESALFNYVILNKRKEIIDILDRNLPLLEEQEEFRKKYGQYVLQIDKGMSYGKELQDGLRSFEDRAEKVLSDFERLNFDFKDNKCEDSSDFVNYNNGWPADPFDKIANYYREDDIFLFNYVVLSKRKEIMGILDKKLTSKDQEELKENFKKRLGRYLIRIGERMSDGQEFLKTGSAMLSLMGVMCHVHMQTVFLIIMTILISTLLDLNKV
ncbi:hypothetical protein OZD68_01110 [Wolbachia endosymbiont of Drosophila bicornuta]|uniref:hypothetical protein n=1 Tax=Wolbachia TaxID=953 RepID=UPI0021752581|nr:MULTISPECIES: hypothetical protein [Wolbachia]MDE5056208.1 hypothetical protein [Wolbachia endosymbiont of Drosophila bicornuta]